MARKKRGGRAKSRRAKGPGAKAGRTAKRKRGAARANKSRSRFLDVAIVAMLFLAIYFAIFGGEYTLFEIKKLEALERERAAELARTEAEIDSLEAVARMLERDPAAIERVARERYGMIREGEILYRFREGAPADSTKDDAGS